MPWNPRRIAGKIKRSLKPAQTPPRNLAEYLAHPLPHERLLTELLSPANVSVVFDVGACEGEDSVRYRNLFPAAQVYACEPLPGNQDRIAETLQRYGHHRITVVTEALSESVGTAEFHVSSGRPEQAGDEPWDYGNKSSSLLPPGAAQQQVHEWLKFEETITVQTTTLSELMTRHGIDRIDFLHMDVQGAELMVLRGAGERVADIGAVWLEVEAVELYADQPLKDEVETFMTAAGFELHLDKVGAVSGDQLWVNVTRNGGQLRGSV